jgi:hypothetical protein
MCRRRNAALLSVLTAAVMIAGAVPHAAAGSPKPSRAVLQDGAGDVWASLPSPLAFVPAPPGHGRSTDFTRVLIRHRHRALGIHMKFVDLQPRGDQTVVIGLETPWLYMAMVRASSRGRDEPHGLFNLVTEIDCPGFTYEIDYAADRISVRIPRSCIGEPEWVTVQMRSGLTGHPTAPPYNDNPHNDQALGAGESVGPLYREAAEEPTTRAPAPATAEE